MPTGKTYYGKELRKVPLSYLIHLWNNSDLQAISYSSSINATSYVTPEWRVKLANYIYNRRRLWKSSEAFRKMRETVDA